MTNPVTTRPVSGLPGGQPPPGAARVLAALEAVRDPELDEPITTLGFVASCTVSVGELHALRADFLRKAVLAGTDQVCRPLAAAGTGAAELAALTRGQTPPSPA